MRLRLGYALVFLASVSVQAIGAETYRKLSDAEVKAKLAGMEMSGPHSSEQYMRDGTVRIVTMGRRIVGKWRVKDGKLCIEAPRAEDSRCKEVLALGRQVSIPARRGSCSLRYDTAKEGAARMVRDHTLRPAR